MTTTDYEKFIKEEAGLYQNKPYVVIALNEEAGEVAGWFKKFELKKNKNLKSKLTKDDLLEEIGDVQFYLTRLANLYGWTMQDVFKSSIKKIRGEEKYGKLHCKEHPTYKAKKMPVAQCPDCWKVWLKKNGK